MANNLNLSIKINADGSGLSVALKDAQGKLHQLGLTGKQAGDGINKGMESARAGSQAFGAGLQSIKSSLIGLASVAGLAGLAKSFVETADAVNSLNARLKLATKSTQEYTAAKQGVVDIAKRTGQSLESVGTLYAKVADALRQMGVSQKDTLQFTEATAQAMRLSGASAASAEAGILQLSQALASGVLRGDEFNSIMENSPRLAQAMADGLRVPRGALRQMAEEGKLTADVVTQSILSQSAALSGEFAQMPVTVGQAFTKLSNAFMLWVEQVDSSTGVTNKFAAALAWLADNLGMVTSAVGTLVSIALPALALRAIPAVIAAIKTLYASVSLLYLKFSQPVGTVMPGAIGSISKLQAASYGLMSLWAGWEIGTWARENFESVRLAGVAMASGLHVAFATLTGASKQEIQAIKDGYFEVFQASTDKAQQASAAAVAASEAAVAKTKAQLEQESAAYKALTSTIKANYDQRLADLSANLQQQLALIDASGLNETAKEAAKTAAILAAHTERLAAIKLYQGEIIKLIDEEKTARLAASKSSGETEKQINLDTMNARRAALAGILKDYQAHFNDLSSQYSAHLAHVQQIEQAKRDAVAGVEATIRDLARETMTERQAYSDKQKEVEELQSAARKALAEGDYAHAQEYANKSIALAKSMAKEVKDGDQVVIDKRTAVGEATRQVKESLDLMKQAYDGQGASAKKEAEATQSAMAETKSGVDSLKIAIGELDAALASQHSLTVKHNVDEVKRAINSLNGQNTSSTHTINVKRVEQNASGGLVGAGIRRFATGGPVAAMIQKFATGGPVFRKPGWAKVPGSGNGDTVPAALTGGSFVVKKSASAYYGDGLMGKIAAGVQKFAMGGSVLDEDKSDINAMLAEINSLIGKMNAFNFSNPGRVGPFYAWSLEKELKANKIRTPVKPEDKDKLEKLVEHWRENIGIMNWEDDVYKGKRHGSFGFAEGGDVGTDTVPAMLTPGEWVVKKSAVGKYGLGFLDALNNMRIPRSALDGIGAPPVARFADGGLVGGGSLPPQSPMPAGQTSNTNNFYLSGFTGSEDDVRRKIVPVLDKINYGSR
ncbi:MAG: tape measure protein [Sulfurimicrobium sp.]|nr:tape measure protein [Sulfurimicrobium sp.]